MVKKNKKMLDANKLKEKIAQLDEMEMYSIYQILDKNKVNITNNMNGIYFDLLGLDDSIFKTINKFVDQSLKRKKMYKKNQFNKNTL